MVLWTLAVGLLVACCALSLCSAQRPYDFPDHPLKVQFLSHLAACKANVTDCANRVDQVTLLAARIANDYSGLLHPDIAQSLLQEAFYYVEPSSQLGTRMHHMLAVLAFSQGDQLGAQKYWEALNRTDLVALRSLSAQMLMKGSDERKGIEQMNHYTAALSDRFERVLQTALKPLPGT